MPEIFGINIGEKSAEAASLREALNEDKKRVSDELVFYKSVAKDLRKARKKLENAEIAYGRRESAKNASRTEDAKDELNAALNAFAESEGQISLLLDTVQTDYASIAELYRGRKAERIMDAFEKYSNSVETKMIDIQAYSETDDYLESNEEEEETTMAIPEIPVANAAPAQAAAPQQNPAPAYAAPAYQYPQYIPVPMPMPYSYAPQQAPSDAAQTPNIAPVSIDVSPMLEKALEATMQKFVAAFDKKLERFVSEHPVNLPAQGGISVGSGEISSLEGLILNDEQAIIDKLTAMIETLKTLSTAMNELSTICADIAVKQNTANEMQRQTNDMQRQTLREQKGVQVGQRVVNQDQALVTSEQSALQEKQKAMLESQKSLVEGQQAMEETQRLVAENQAAIDAAMQAAVAVQKDVLAAQQAINAGNSKNLDAMGDVAEKQSANLALQKEALAAQRQFARDQKAMIEKQKSLGSDAKK